MSFGAFFGIFWPDKSLTLSRISETNFGLDQLEDLICSCARTKLYLLLIFPTTYYLQSSIETELICLSIQTNHLPCAKSLRPISALTNLRTSSAVALGPNSICYLFFLLCTTYKAALKQNWSCLFLAFFTFFGQTNHLPCAESLRPILALTNLRTSSAVALGSNSMAWNWPSMKWNRA